MNKLTSIRIKQNDGTYSDDIPIQVLAENVSWILGSSISLLDILGDVKYTTKGSIQHQLDTFSLDEVENARVGADDTQYQNLKARLDGEYEDLQNAIAAVATNLQTQTGARSNADAAIRTDLSSETTARINGDNLLSSQIATEVNARKAAIKSEITDRNNAISSAIATEVNNRNEAISTEASARANADNNLQTQINQLVSPSGEAPSAAEVENARVGADGLTYSTLGDAIREQNTDITDIINGSGVEHMYFNTSNTSRFNQATNSRDIWMKQRIFKKGYVKYIQFHRNAESSTYPYIKIWFCDVNRIIFKVVGKEDSTKDPIVYINDYINDDFLLAFSCCGQRFGHVDATSSLRCSGWSYDGYGHVGTTYTFPELTVTDALNFDVDICYANLNDYVNDVDSKTDSDYSVGTFEEWMLSDDKITPHFDSLNEGIYGSAFEFPSGYVKSITLLYKTASTDQIMIWITDKHSLILKKVIDYARNKVGPLDVQIDYYCDEPFYVFVRAPGVLWSSYGTVRCQRWNGSWGTYGFNTEGQYLVGSSTISWGNNDFVWVATTVNYGPSNTRRRLMADGERLYTLEDAYSEWLFDNTAKFPILVLGDSTTDADTTTGATANVIGTDHQDPNSYTTILQSYLREALGNNALRIYNAGFSGKNAGWALTNLDSIVWNNPYYSDLKIMVISHGINDYAVTRNSLNGYRYVLRQLVLECFSHGVQPVMMTTQAGTENHGRFGWKQMSLADKITKEIAEEYNLEVIDKNAYTAFFNVYSSYRMNQIIPDGCHYSDVGHKFVAGAMFKELVPFTVVAGDGTTILSFADERLRTDLEFSSFSGYIWKDVKVITPANGFKLEASCSKNASVKMMDYWVFVYAKNKKRLISYCTTPNVQTVMVDGTSYNVTSSEQQITTLDLGLHHIVVNSAASTNVNYLGLKLLD